MQVFNTRWKLLKQICRYRTCKTPWNLGISTLFWRGPYFSMFDKNQHRRRKGRGFDSHRAHQEPWNFNILRFFIFPHFCIFPWFSHGRFRWGILKDCAWDYLPWISFICDKQFYISPHARFSTCIFSAKYARPACKIMASFFSFCFFVLSFPWNKKIAHRPFVDLGAFHHSPSFSMWFTWSAVCHLPGHLSQCFSWWAAALFRSGSRWPLSWFFFFPNVQKKWTIAHFVRLQLQDNYRIAAMDLSPYFLLFLLIFFLKWLILEKYPPSCACHATKNMWGIRSLYPLCLFRNRGDNPLACAMPGRKRKDPFRRFRPKYTYLSHGGLRRVPLHSDFFPVGFFPCRRRSLRHGSSF